MQTDNRNRKRRAGQRGMTILEIMIVLAIIALVMGFLVGPKIMKMFGESKGDTTRLMLKEYAEEAYPLWQRKNGNKCPAALGDLNEYTNRKTAQTAKDGKADINDAWGNPMALVCPPPPGARGIGVVSAGEDGKMDTGDDIHSWD